MNYLVIDLEMCKVPKNYRGKNYKYASEIIQVGAVLLDEEYKEIGTLCQYVCIIAMPFFYSISEGISMGVISYVVINLITGEAKEKKISALMYVLAILFILKYIFL